LGGAAGRGNKEKRGGEAERRQETLGGRLDGKGSHRERGDGAARVTHKLIDEEEKK